MWIQATGGRWRKSTVYGLNGHRPYYTICLFKVTYKLTIQVSRNFNALFTKTLENSDLHSEPGAAIDRAETY